jgi:predicted nucleic acid-binding protein
VSSQKKCKFDDGAVRKVLRRGCITSADERAFLAALSHLHIELEETVPAVTAIREATAAAMRYGLTAYDAAYVELAAREGLTWPTLVLRRDQNPD